MSGLLVITPTLGRSRWLDETMASVAGLPFACRHVLVCPAEARAGLEKRFPRTHVVTQPGSGLYAAINAGLAAVADWDAFTWLNDDDVLCAAGTTTAVHRLREDDQVGVVYGRVSLMDAEGAPQGWLPVAHRPADFAGLLASLRGLDESYRLAGDLDFFSRTLAAGAQFDYVPAEVARFRLHAGQLSRSEAIGDAEKARALAPWGNTPAPLGAVVRFRRDNLPVYLDRIRRHGFVSMRSLYRGA